MVVRQTLGEQHPSAVLERRFRAGDPAVTAEDLGTAKARELRRELSEEDAAREEQRLAELEELCRDVAAYELPDLLALAAAARAALDDLVGAMLEHETVVRSAHGRLVRLGVAQPDSQGVTAGRRTLSTFNPLQLLEKLVADCQSAHRLPPTNNIGPASLPAVEVQLRGLDRTR